MKATAIAPSNIAFIKYWGKKDERLRLPENGSISMNLSNLVTTTTIEFDERYAEDTLSINGMESTGDTERATKHLDRIRHMAGISTKAKVMSTNSFPSGTGLSSSASGFAALSMAAAEALHLKLSEKELSILARQGSGSACRSIPSGITEWLDGETSETSYAVSLFAPDYWDITDLVAVVNSGKKDVPTAEGMKRAQESPFFNLRKSRMAEKIKQIKEHIRNKDFQKFGELIEAEALEMHAVMLTSIPSLIYWHPGTVQVMRYVKKWRSEGLPVYFTINTGQDIHLIVEDKHTDELVQLVKRIEEVKDIILNKSSEGARLSHDHLF